jgi:hypothetical protein
MNQDLRVGAIDIGVAKSLTTNTVSLAPISHEPVRERHKDPARIDLGSIPDPGIRR